MFLHVDAVRSDPRTDEFLGAERLREDENLGRDEDARPTGA